MITANGVFDFENQVVTAPSTGTWASLTTWAEWTNYATSTADSMTWLLDPVDLGDERQFCLTINTQTNGIVDYYVYTSDTGAFNGEEIETVILAEDAGIAAFTARYYQIGVSVERLADPQQITGIEVRVVQGRNKFSIDNIDTADINDGSSEGYLLPLGRPVGTITNVQITPQAVTPFQLDVYVTDDATSTVVIPHVTNKTSDSVSFALYGLDNKPRDAIVDVLIEYLPEMFRDGNALRVR
jgi:hypothetical protein